MHTCISARLRHAGFLATVFIGAATVASCSSRTAGSADGATAHKLPDTLRVVTLNSPTSYFIYRDQPMGYDYTLADSLARQKGMVLDLTVAPNLSRAVAMLNKTYYPDLDISLDVSFPQRASWAVAKDKEWLADSINVWFAQESPQRTNAELLKRFYEQSKGLPMVNFDFSKGYISRYDDLFKKYAPTVGWDWRLMAAQAYQESRFRPNARSWVGARGLMQIMPATARGYRTPVSKLNNPETSVKVASALINDLDGYLKKYVPNDKERIKFVIAAYNVGIAHVYDAIRLAEKYGLDPTTWNGNVEKAILMKMNPKYYNDPVVKYGYCRGTETVDYVDKITKFYEHARRENYRRLFQGI